MHIGRKAPPPPPKPRPVISEPIPGSGRKIEGQGSAGRPVPPNPAPAARPGIPKNEYPRNHAVPNNVFMQRPDGKLEKHTLPPGAKLSSPMGGGHPSQSTDSHVQGWPANNHYTDKYNDLRKGYREAEARHETAPKEGKKEAKTAMLQAKREMEVYRQRFSRPMSTEADHRETVGRQSRAEARAWRPPAEEPSVAPKARPNPPTSFPKASKQPGLSTIAEHEPEMTFPAGTRPSTNTGYSTRNSSSRPVLPHSDQVYKLQSQYGEAKKNYHGIKGEPGNHSRQELHNARAEYLVAKDNLDNFRKVNKDALKSESAQLQRYNQLDRETFRAPRGGLPPPESPFDPRPQPQQSAPTQSHAARRIAMGLPGLPQPPASSSAPAQNQPGLRRTGHVDFSRAIDPLDRMELAHTLNIDLPQGSPISSHRTSMSSMDSAEEASMRERLRRLKE